MPKLSQIKKAIETEYLNESLKRGVLMKPIRILHFGIVGGLGGVDTFLMNLYKHIDREKVQFDFILNHDTRAYFQDEFEAMGAKIYPIMYSKRECVLKHNHILDNFFKEHTEISGVHMHMNFIRYYAPLVYAKKYNVPIRIYHSHNSQDMYPSKSIIKEVTEAIARKNIGKYTTDLFACSNIAGKYMFEDKSFKVIKNAIETDKYVFNENIRIAKRKELGVGDKFVVGFVGRLQYQKNPEFIIDIFNELHKKMPNSVLAMVGVGRLEEKVREKMSIYNIQDSVLMLGKRDDVAELLQAFDCFLLPSRFEGLGIVAIEAQTAGLPCFLSDGVPEETNITDLATYISLNNSADEWANEILNKSIGLNRRNVQQKIINAGYDIKNMAKNMESYYLNHTL